MAWSDPSRTLYFTEHFHWVALGQWCSTRESELCAIFHRGSLMKELLSHLEHVFQALIIFNVLVLLGFDHGVTVCALKLRHRLRGCDSRLNVWRVSIHNRLLPCFPIGGQHGLFGLMGHVGQVLIAKLNLLPVFLRAALMPRHHAEDIAGTGAICPDRVHLQTPSPSQFLCSLVGLES